MKFKKTLLTSLFNATPNNSTPDKTEFQTKLAEVKAIVADFNAKKAAEAEAETKATSEVKASLSIDGAKVTNASIGGGIMQPAAEPPRFAIGSTGLASIWRTGVG